MKCTSCKKGTLNPAYLDDLFPCHTCSNCGGNLVALKDYLRWFEENSNAQLNEKSDVETQIEETTSAMLCPKTGRFMIKYRVSKDTDHRLDLSPSINVVWMDKGEWALLKSKGLAGNLRAIFTDKWQRKIRDASTADTLDALYEKEFGEHYSTIKTFRSMFDKLENKAEVIAFLMSEDPYKT